VRLVAGVDVSVSRATGKARAAVVVLSYPDLMLAEMAIAEGELTFPYVPGLLSFREIPLLAEALYKINKIPDLVLVDGQGIAHPRRIGLASHLGLLTGLPTIGCAKSRLCGEYDEPPQQAGEYTELKDKGEVIGVALRTKQNCNPVFVSPGHMIGMKESAGWVAGLCRGYRLPQPVRLAHLAAGGNIKGQKAGVKSQLQSR
jgi:deoxyribonuclease V